MMAEIAMATISTRTFHPPSSLPPPPFLNASSRQSPPMHLTQAQLKAKAAREACAHKGRKPAFNGELPRRSRNRKRSQPNLPLLPQILPSTASGT
jgi:hypothetical protein